MRLLDLGSGRVEPLSGAHGGRGERHGIHARRAHARERAATTAGASRGTSTRRTIAQRSPGTAGGSSGLDVEPGRTHACERSEDGSAILWDLAGDRGSTGRFASAGRSRSTTRRAGSRSAPTAARSPSPQRRGGRPGRHATLRRRASAARADAAAALSIAFSPDGRLLAVDRRRGRVTLWDARTLAPAGELKGLRGGSARRSPSRPTGSCSPPPRPTRRTAARLRVWDVRSRTLTAFRAPELRWPDRLQPGRAGCSPWPPTSAAPRSATSTDRLAALGISDVPGDTTSRARSRSRRDGELLFVGQYDGRRWCTRPTDWRPSAGRWKRTRRGSRPRLHRTGARW